MVDNLIRSSESVLMCTQRVEDYWITATRQILLHPNKWVRALHYVVRWMSLAHRCHQTHEAKSPLQSDCVMSGKRPAPSPRDGFNMYFILILQAFQKPVSACCCGLVGIDLSLPGKPLESSSSEFFVLCFYFNIILS